MLDLQTRRKICEDTITRSASIASSTPGGSLSSDFIPSQLPPLSKSHANYPNLTLAPITVHNSDTFALARTLPPGSKTAVLNLASNYEPGGGWRYTLSATQEEALCYSSTLFATLKAEWYPWANLGVESCKGIYSPGVVVFKDTLENNCVDLPEPHVLGVITIAAPCQPALTPDGQGFANETDLNDLRERIVLILRIAAENGARSLVLGAMGCGAYGCPPELVAREMKGMVEQQEFRGWFERIVFAVYAAGRVGKGNLEVFKEVFR
ncbi:hypothetical protein HBI79_138300 [Parastagonospora nodorum]|nr:hypothetical protein HBI79_138300 [Parastagonospora nodorum]